MNKIVGDPLLRYIKKKSFNFDKVSNWKKVYEGFVLNELAVQFYQDNKNQKQIPEKIIKKLKKKEKEFEKFLKGLDYFLSLMKRKKFDDFVVIKLKDILKAHTDFDILVTKGNSLILKEILEAEQFKIKDSIGYEISMRKVIEGRDFVVDIHCGISYNNGDFLEFGNLFENLQKKDYCKRVVNFCSNENDFIITLIHSFFQKVAVRRTPRFNQLKWSEITLSDLYQLHKISTNKQFNWNYVVETSRNFGWEDALIYYLVALDIFFPNKTRKNILKSIDLKKKGLKFETEIINTTNFPIYTKISTTYLICFSKLKNNFLKNPSKGFIYFFNMHKWFLSNGIRIIYHKIKK